ncbi:hypothetical protein U2453_30865, partial [Klebsiella pneumoniae]
AFLYTVDDLERAVEDNRRGRREAAAEAEAIIDLQVSRFIETQQASAHQAPLRQLRAFGEATRTELLERARQQLANGKPADEVLELLAPALRQQLPGLQSRLGTPTEQAPPALLPARWADDPDYQCLWRALDHDPSSMDSLITRCALTAPQVSSMLLAMELAGIVVCVHGRYCRTP